jgi:hypothetical protein
MMYGPYDTPATLLVPYDGDQKAFKRRPHYVFFKKRWRRVMKAEYHDYGGWRMASNNKVMLTLGGLPKPRLVNGGTRFEQVIEPHKTWLDSNEVVE